MTNYNEKLEEIMDGYLAPAWIQQKHTTTNVPSYGLHLNEAKQAINSLFKELVAEAKPEKRNERKAEKTLGAFLSGQPYPVDQESSGFNHAIDEFEQNLLKVLEENSEA